MHRLTRGVSYDEYAARTGCDAGRDFADLIDRLAKLELLESDERGFRLTEKGLSVADTIGAEFLAP